MDGWHDPLRALEAYETWLARQPLSPRTRGEYLRWVRLFCAWLRGEVDERVCAQRVLVGAVAQPGAEHAHPAQVLPARARRQGLTREPRLVCLKYL